MSLEERTLQAQERFSSSRAWASAANHTQPPRLEMARPARSDPGPSLGREKEGAEPAAATRAGRGSRTAVGSAQVSFALTVLGADRLPSAAVSEHGQRPLHFRGGVLVEFHSHRGQPASASLSPAAATAAATAVTAWNGPKRGRGDCWEHRSPDPAAGQGGKERRDGRGSEKY